MLTQGTEWNISRGALCTASYKLFSSSHIKHFLASWILFCFVHLILAIQAAQFSQCRFLKSPMCQCVRMCLSSRDVIVVHPPIGFMYGQIANLIFSPSSGVVLKQSTLLKCWYCSLLQCYSNVSSKNPTLADILPQKWHIVSDVWNTCCIFQYRRHWGTEKQLVLTFFRLQCVCPLTSILMLSPCMPGEASASLSLCVSNSSLSTSISLSWGNISTVHWRAKTKSTQTQFSVWEWMAFSASSVNQRMSNT